MVEFEFIRLPSKPEGQLSYRFYPSTAASTEKPLLVVFVNGLGLPQAEWTNAITKLQELRKDGSLPPILTYDRFGQGQTTDRDPLDKDAPDPTHAHDCMRAVDDLRELLAQITQQRMAIPDLDDVSIVFVANSIGCALARLFAYEYPGSVAGMLLLDSVLANSDFVSIFPDPDSEGFDAGILPAGTTVDDLRHSRELVRKMFHPSVGSKEGLSRMNLAELLPASDAPMLEGPDSRGPFITVVGHDFETFAAESEKTGWKRELTMAYTNPFWHAYNEGLTMITEPGRSSGPIQAPHSGHFIQRDNPDFVAKELDLLLSKIT
jgi:pimeloyl-ACP methyl ester carboxylesterase